MLRDYQQELVGLKEKDLTMKYVLIKYKNIKLLINEGVQIQPLLSHLSEIENLASRVNEFHKNILTAKKNDGALLEKEAAALISKIGYKIIGTPLSNHDAELYALNKKLEYSELELHGNTGKTNAAKVEAKDSHIHMRVTQSQKGEWVKKSQAKGMKLAEWITKKLNDEL